MGENTSSSQEPTTTSTPEDVNKALDNLARDLAAAGKLESVRKAIKEETDTLLAGQRNVLYKQIASKSLSSAKGKAQGQTFEEVLAQQRAVTGGAKSVSKATAGVQKDAATVPKFDIGVPVNYKLWKDGAPEEAPLVAFQHKQQADDLELERVKAYDADGNVHWLSAEGPPEDRPVVVIGINERLSEEQVRKISEGTAQSKFLGIDPPCLIGCGDDEDDGPGSIQYDDDWRNTGDAEYLDRVKVTDDHEPWWHGDPEIKIAIFSNKNDGIDDFPLYQAELDRDGASAAFWGRTSDDRSWNEYDRSLFTWGGQQEFALYYFYEYDNGVNLGRNTIVFQGEEYGLGSLEWSEDSDPFGKKKVRKGSDDDVPFAGDTDEGHNLGDLQFKLESRDS